MKRLIPWLLILGLGAGLGVGGFYVALHWRRLNPLREKGQDLPAVLTRLRKACVNEKELQGASIRKVESADNKLVLHGWIADKKQQSTLEAMAQSLLDESPDLQHLCPDGVSLALTVFVIPKLLTQLQHDFEESKGADADVSGLQRAVMRTTRLDAASFTEDARLHVHAVCMRGSAKQDTSAAALNTAIKRQLEASGLASETVPDLILDVRYFTSPAALLQEELARTEGAKDVLITAAWYDGLGKLHIDGIRTKEEQGPLVKNALTRITKDPNNSALFRAAETSNEKVDIDVRLELIDDAILTAQLQKRLVEDARKNNNARLRRVRISSVAAEADKNDKNEPVVDDEGNPSYVFRVVARSLTDNARQRDEILNELGTWLGPRMPLVTNPDQRPMTFQIDMRSKPNPSFALQDRLIGRGLDGAVISDALYDEMGTLELFGRVHAPGDENKQAIDAALGNLLMDDAPWTTALLQAHETRQNGELIAWKDVVASAKIKLAADVVGKRLRLDRLYFRYEKEQLRLVADGAFLTSVGKDDLAKTLTAAVDEITATRGKAGPSLAALKTLKNPLPELQNACAERLDLDGVLLTQARYDADGVLHLDGFVGQRGQKSLLAELALERLGKITAILKKGSDPKTSPGWTIDALKVHGSLKGESSWRDVVSACQSALAADAVQRRASLERMHFQYDDPQSLQATLVCKATYLRTPDEKVDEPALARTLADACKTMLPDLPNFQVQPALTKAATPIYALQELAVKRKLDGLLFADAYFDREGKLVLEGKRGNDEQLKDVKTLIEQVMAESKPPIAPAGLASFERMQLVPWQPLLLDIRAQFAQGSATFQRQTRIDRIYFQHDDAAQKTQIYVEGVSIYQGKTPTSEEQTASVRGILRKHLDARGMEKLAVSLRGIERKPNPAAEMQTRAVEMGIDGAVFNLAFDAKGVCVVQMPFIPAGHEEAIRKLLEEFSKKHKDDLGTLQLR